VVERKSWLHEALSDLMVLVWCGDSEATARERALLDLARLERQLAEQDARLPDDGTVRVAFACTEIDDGNEDSDRGERVRLRDVVGRVLASPVEWPLSRREAYAVPADGGRGGS
jgi:hypothetical protein